MGKLLFFKKGKEKRSDGCKPDCSGKRQNDSCWQDARKVFIEKLLRFVLIC
jgi:hypothetical protein